jgi:hypothetical protein
VDGREVLVAVAEVVLAELSGGIAVVLQQLGNGRVLVTQALLGRRHADLGQPGAEGNLASDEVGATGRAALLGVVVREDGAFVGDAVDVGCGVTHHPAAVGADVRDADVIAPDDEDVGLVPTG